MRKVYCDYCGRQAEYVDSKIVYGKSYGMMYLCRNCMAYVGVHKGTDKPLGRLGKWTRKHIGGTLGKIILGEQGGRTGEEEILCFINDGMAIFDMGLCHDLYETALEQGLGQKLLLWESPAQCED